MSIVTLMTDFGLEDPYVGTMHGVIYNINAEARLVDLSHSVQPQKVEQAAFLLSNVYRYFPASTVHLAVVDPGVGTTRKAIGLSIAEVGMFVGPDNGLFSYILEAAAANDKNIVAHELLNPAYRLAQVSTTFHGRDIFAPAAAYLAKGVPLQEFGPALSVEQLVRFNVSVPQWETQARAKFRQLQGQVVHIDHFGNIITNLPAHLFSELLEKQKLALVVHYQGLPFSPIQGLSFTYEDKQADRFKTIVYGNLINLISSSGYLEIAKPDGNAAQVLNAIIGDKITVRVPAN